jgi:hypothetical protein
VSMLLTGFLTWGAAALLYALIRRSK